MQISQPFSNGAPPPQGGGSPDIARQLQQLREQQQRILRGRAIRANWYPIALAIVGGLIGGYIGPSALDYYKETFGGIAAVLLVFWGVTRFEFGLFLLGVMATPFIPTAVKTDWFYISPDIPILIMFAIEGAILLGFRVRRAILPSAWVIWPLIGLFLLACISEAYAQLTWEPDVAHSILGNPIVVDESVGIFTYSMPLLTLFVAAVALTSKGKWTRAVLLGLLSAAIIDALVVMIKYKSLGGDVYAFRYTSPSIGWMPLESLAQLLGLGCIIGYSFTLNARTLRDRIIYGCATGLCLLSLYFSFENSWWTEVGVALVVMTIIYSWRLLIVYAIGGLSLIPLLPTLLAKLQQKGQVDALRLIIWQDMLRIWHKRPILGVGPGNVWAYDQVSSHLPQGLRNIDLSGLGVAHEGYLQTLTELGPLGLLCQIAFLLLLILAAWRLFRFAKQRGWLNESILGLAGLGLVCGAMAGDLTSSYFFLPPRQALHVVNLPMALMHWVVYGCVLYKDKIRRMTLKGLKVEPDD